MVHNWLQYFQMTNIALKELQKEGRILRNLSEVETFAGSYL